MPASTAAAHDSTKNSIAGEQTVTMDRRRKERRDKEMQAAGNEAPAKKTPANATTADAVPRRQKQRRRHIDPTTCERDYSEHEVEFMKAMDDYKHSSGRMFPTCSEVLEVLRSLGYVQLNDEQFEQLGLEENNLNDDEAVVSEEEADEMAVCG